MEKKFTPGPWQVELAEPNDMDISLNVTTEETIVCGVYYDSDPESKDLANMDALLISCAPEMFDLLERYMNLIDSGDLTNAVLLYSETKELLTKATTINP